MMMIDRILPSDDNGKFWLCFFGIVGIVVMTISISITTYQCYKINHLPTEEQVNERIHEEMKSMRFRLEPTE